jgi:alpha-methylacyl-CoA racemase
MSDPTSLPLDGLKIVELHAIGPVPFAGQLLRGLGAEVARVSPPNDPGWAWRWTRAST